MLSKNCFTAIRLPGHRPHMVHPFLPRWTHPPGHHRCCLHPHCSRRKCVAGGDRGGVPGKAFPSQDLLSYTLQGGRGICVCTFANIRQRDGAFEVKVGSCRCLLPDTICLKLEGDFGESLHSQLHGGDTKVVGNHVHQGHDTLCQTDSNLAVLRQQIRNVFRGRETVSENVIASDKM